VTVNYINDSDERKQEWKSLPKGLEEHDIYLIKHKVMAPKDDVPIEAIED